jgi:hypothetical protein
METTERMQPVIRVVDIPDEVTAKEAERLMNAPCEEANYLLVNVLYMEPLRSTRAVYRLSAREQAGTVTGNRPDSDGNWGLTARRLGWPMRGWTPVARGPN